jgi:phosphate transport system permease protein
VRFGDGLARLVVTTAGIGTIAAVLLMGLFLFAVVLPLLLSARAGAVGRVVAARSRGPVVLGCDEQGRVGWWVDAAARRLVCFDADRGATVLARPVAADWLEGSTSLRLLPGRLDAVVGRDDGTFQLGRLGVESSFVGRGELSAAAAGLAVGELTVEEDTILFHPAPEQWVRITPIAAAVGTASAPLDAAVIDVDLAQGPRGPIVVALAADGTVRVETTSSRRNLLTDEAIVSREGATLSAAAEGFVPAFARVADLGDQLFLVARDGRGRRYSIRDIAAPTLAEEFAATPKGTVVTAVARLFGGSSLAVGDDHGDVHVLFTVRSPRATAADGLAMTVARSIAAAQAGTPVAALAASPRSRIVAAAAADGTVRLLHSTSARSLLTLVAGAGTPQGLAIGPRERTVLAADDGGVWACRFDPGFPEVSVRTLLTPVWYESYPAAVQAWETTGHDAFEPKYGFVPLVVGTLKSTFYSMAFAAPVALFAAVYSSQFLQPRWRARIKPVIEMMASLPSVVLGFVAGLVLAPLVETLLPAVILAVFAVPLTLVVAAHAWQVLPAAIRVGGVRWRFPLIAMVGLPLGCVLARLAAPWLEWALFDGSLRRWLDGGDGHALGGWVLTLLPGTAIVIAVVVARIVNPWLRRALAGWSPQRAALVSLATCGGAALAAVLLAVLIGMFLESYRVDPRAVVVGGYVQRNAMVVAFGMSFAIIPLVFTLADDALSSVPEHLRSASLGAGATPWQTAVRVIIPAAGSGLFSAVMIGLGRAVGETMIVLMAAGNTPILDWNLFNGFQTLSAAVATELPEAARGSAHYRVLFLVALVLFAITFVINTAAEIVRQRFRRRAHEL